MFYLEVWFWGFIIGLLLFILGILFYDYNRTTQEKETPVFVWLLIGVGAVFLILSLVIYILETPSPIARCVRTKENICEPSPVSCAL